MGLTIDRIVAGATFDHTVTLTAYPAPDWALALALRGAGVINLTATPEGASHRFVVAAATTAVFAPGVHWYVLRATRDGEVVQIDDGQIEIAPDLTAQLAGFDGRSHAERVLAAIEAVIEGRATIDQQSYQINNRQLARTPIPDLLLLRSKYREEVRQERRAAGGQSLLGRPIRVRLP